MKDWIFSILLAGAIMACLFVLNGVFLWAVGVCVCRVFLIDYNWTFWHGLITGIILAIISSTFTTKITK